MIPKTKRPARSLTPHLSAALAAQLIVVAFSAQALAAAYQFASKYDNAPPTPSKLYYYTFDFGATPAINNAGMLAFGATYHQIHQPAVTVFGLWRGDGGPLTYLTDNFDLDVPIDMNNLGEVAFLGTAGDVFKTNGFTPPIPIATTLDYSGINNSPSPFPASAAHINDAGQVVFNAIPKLGPQEQTVFVGSGGPVFPAGPSGYGEAINNLGLLAVSTSTGAQILGVPPIGPATVLANLPSGFDGIGYPEMNNAGDVITGALRSGTADFWVIQFEQGVPQVLAMSGIYSHDINNAGEIAFETSTGVPAGIYAGPNLATDSVIKVGDSLFGSTLTGLSFGPDGLNDLGQIAFYYQLANGRNGIAIATPVPEPGTFAIWSICAVALSITSLRRQHRRRV